MDYIFISLAGTQIMGTLQPLMGAALRHKPSAIFVLATAKVRPLSENLQNFSLEQGLDNVNIIDISHSLSADNAAPTIVAALAQEAAAQGRRVVFNLDGGLNYMINACVLALEPFTPILVQASAWRLIATDTTTGESTPWLLPQALAPQKLLDLQGVQHTTQPIEGWDIVTFCERGSIPLPEQYLQGVVVDGIAFDLVWNAGNNRLCFLKSLFIPKQDAHTRKIEERDLGHWATVRERSNQLYDRTVIILVQDVKAAERLHKESGGKLTVENVQGWRAQPQLLRDPLLRHLGRKPVEMKEKPLPPPRVREQEPLQDGTLIVCVGNNVSTTLLAICSHQPQHLVLCYTDKVEQVAAHARKVQELASDLGVQSVHVVPLSIEGLHLDTLLPLPAEAAKVQINVTPGSTGQGAMLSLWGRKHGCSVWSLDNETRCCTALFNPQAEKSIPLRWCDPALLLRLQGQELLDAGLSESDMQEELPLLDGLLAFMRSALAEGKDENVLRCPVKAGGMTLHRPKFDEWELHVDGVTHPFVLKGGEWLEKLATIAMLRAGAEHARARVRLRWNEENEQGILARNPHITELFRLDLDVVGTWDSDIFLLSCKSHPQENMINAVEDVRLAATSLGRFSLRILAHMGCPKARMYDDVLVLGWRELCQPEVLRELMEQLREQPRTVRDKKEQ